MDKTMERKNTFAGFASLVSAMLLYSISGVMVTWLGIAFPPGAQLIVRATVGVLISLIWIWFSKSGIRLSKNNKYNIRALILDIVTRPMFNFCFIMAVYGFKEATFALLLLFAAKVVVGGIITTFYKKTKLGVLDYICYAMALTGILVYNWGSVFQWMFLWAVGSGILEAIKSEAMHKLNLSDRDKPTVSLYEFLGVVVAGVAILVVLDKGVFIKPDGFVNGFVLDTYMGIGKTYLGIFLSATAVLALAFEFYGFSNFSADLGNVILATELGVAGWINFVLLSSPDHPILFGFQQIFALTVFVLSAILVSKAEAVRSAEEKKLEAYKGV